MIKLLFTILLNVIGIGFLIAVLVIPIAPQFKNDSRVDQALGVLLCNGGEYLVREQISNPMLQRFGISGITPTCINPQGQRRDVTTRWITIGVSGFTITFVIGIVLEFVLILNAIRRRIARAVRPQTVGVVVPPPPVAVSLSDQLSQLDAAQKAGLITYDEYERLRQEILKKM